MSQGVCYEFGMCGFLRHSFANSVTVEPTLALQLKDIASHLLSRTDMSTRAAIHKRYRRWYRYPLIGSQTAKIIPSLLVPHAK
jgi:hypothetical protein